MAKTLVLAGTLSGVPSTVYAVATGRSVLEATRAAGALLGRPSVVRGGLAHAVITTWWVWVLRRLGVRGALGGLAAGTAIAALDLNVVGRRVPAIAALPVAPQVADHLAFGLVAGVCLKRFRP